MTDFVMTGCRSTIVLGIGCATGQGLFDDGERAQDDLRHLHDAGRDAVGTADSAMGGSAPVPADAAKGSSTDGATANGGRPASTDAAPDAVGRAPAAWATLATSNKAIQSLAATSDALYWTTMDELVTLPRGGVPSIAIGGVLNGGQFELPPRVCANDDEAPGRGAVNCSRGRYNRYVVSIGGTGAPSMDGLLTTRCGASTTSAKSSRFPLHRCASWARCALWDTSSTLPICAS